MSFAEAARAVPVRGTGLSVELYDPPLDSLLAAFPESGPKPEYVEIYRAATADLRAFRSAPAGRIPCEYHADGLWLVQPGYLETRQCREELSNLSEQAAILGASWANHECATKQIRGHTFGAFVPPCLDLESARVIGKNAEAARAAIGSPLLLLETPSFHSWMPGDLPLGDFFAEIAEKSQIGFCVDIGHVFTHFQISRDRTGVGEDEYLRAWLDRAPLERVIELHVAGVRVERPAEARLGAADGTRFVDHHPSPLPSLYLAWLDAHLRHPRLRTLRGVAFEVDGKTPGSIVREFALVRDTVRRARPNFAAQPAESEPAAARPLSVAGEAGTGVRERYERTVELLSGRLTERDREGDEVARERSAIREVFRSQRGGELASLFPDSSAALRAVGIGDEAFDDFFEREPAFEDARFDFFRIVVLTYLAFVRRHAGVAPSGVALAESEAELLLGESSLAPVG